MIYVNISIFFNHWKSDDYFHQMKADIRDEHFGCFDGSHDIPEKKSCVSTILGLKNRFLAKDGSKF